MSPFTTQPAQSVAALGEVRLLKEIRRWLGSAAPRSPAGMGDDCATFAGSPREQLITVDPVIYGHHFDDSVPAAGVAAKLFNRNISDIAAMGGRPRVAVIALALADTVKSAWLEAFYRSLANLARRYHVPVIGGDIATQTNGLTATMTVVGEAMENRVLTRDGARPGDWIFVTGTLGGSRLGWHWKFLPRLQEGQWLVTRGEVRSLTDISDGLAKDLLALTPGGCRPCISAAAVPISRSARLAARQSGRSLLNHALTDGEDYELLFSVNGTVDPAEFTALWRDRFKLKLTCLGRFETVRTRALSPDEIVLADYHGFEHLR